MPESMRRSTEAALGLGLALWLGCAPPAVAGNEYPTPTTVDYVLGCMAANGNTRESMLKCSCSIDFIAKRVPFSQYEMAETALSLQRGGGVGGRVGLFRDPPEIKDAIAQLRRTQAEASLQCGG